MHSLKENKRIGEIPARASRSMNIDRKKATKRRQGLTFHEHWSKKATKRRQGLTFHENRSILKSLGITEKSDREIDNGISPMRLFSFRKCIREFWW